MKKVFLWMIVLTIWLSCKPKRVGITQQQQQQTSSLQDYKDVAMAPIDNLKSNVGFNLG